MLAVKLHQYTVRSIFQLYQNFFNTVKSQINVSQIKDKSQIKDNFCADQLFTT